MTCFRTAYERAMGTGAAREAARAFFSCRGAERRRLEHAFDSLAADPGQRFDAEIKDATGRLNRVLECGRWSIIYWLDAFVKEVRVVSLERDAS